MRRHCSRRTDMSALTPWDPFRELDELQNRLATM
ncbi:MAG: Hsp20/alpha crystallin family protein, partial [Gammaproteobacteria bacterium]